ncbi:IS110 family transposase [Enterococcus mundtii]|uniref:IS110 family transposase n=1 Tax=Enterococcus mundtii TaxID=53346 RepID=UPI002118171B|nr:IS110 family transposase [Enterococcus mundtii]
MEAKKQLEKGSLRSWKTDKIDAHKLAQTHWKNTRLLKIHQAEVFQELRDLARFYQEIEDKISRVHMDLHQALQLTFPELENFFSSRVTPYAFSLIEAFPHPMLVLASTRTKIENHLVKSTGKHIYDYRAWQKANQLLNCAQNSYPAIDSSSIHCQKTSYYAYLFQALLEQKEHLMAQ